MNKVSQPACPPPDEGDKACTRLSKVQQQFSHFGSRLRALSDPANYQDEDEDLAAARKKASRTSPLAALSDEVMAGACTFLPPSDLIFLSRACQRLRAVALRPHLWRDICLQEWGLAPGTPTYSALMQAPLGPQFLELYPLIEEYPSGFNCSALDADSRSTIHADADEEPVEVKTGAKSAGAGSKTALLVEYTGGVGLGNRCVRTDAPFPSPRIWERRSLAARSARHGAAAGPLVLMYKLLRAVHAGGSHSAAATPGAASAALALLGATTCGASVHAAATTPLPFSTPIWTAPGTVDASARVVSYFEVSIAPRTGARGAGVPECIAIGLSEEQFTLQGKMPGWDSCSYGYHSDDGGAFHNAGSMLFRYGPTFGRGDVVGCGLDYSHGGGLCADIFFTLNGRYLGVAFAGVRAGGLYPTVGIDSAAPVRINLGGAAPFAFDVAAFERERRAAAAARARDDAAAAKAAAEARHNTTATRALLLGAAALPALAMARAEAF